MVEKRDYQSVIGVKYNWRRRRWKNMVEKRDYQRADNTDDIIKTFEVDYSKEYQLCCIKYETEWGNIGMIFLKKNKIIGLVNALVEINKEVRKKNE